MDGSPPGSPIPGILQASSLATRGEDWASQGQPKGKAVLLHQIIYTGAITPESTDENTTDDSLISCNKHKTPAVILYPATLQFTWHVCGALVGRYLGCLIAQELY